MSNRPIQLLPPEKTAEKSAYKPVLIAIVSAAAMAAGGCYGFLSLFFSGDWAWLGFSFGIVFVLSGLLFLLSLIWLLFVFVSNTVRGRRG